MNLSRAITFGRLGSTRLQAHPSLLLAGAVLVVLFAPRFDHGGADPHLVGVVFVLALYTSVLAHELAHVAAARACGLRVPRVTLHLLGGETAVAGGMRSPGQEALTAVVGPLASAGVGLLAFLAAGPSTDPTVQQVLWSLGWINLLIGAFNLLPGLPLDGGRVLSAVVWAATGRPEAGAVAAGWTGRACAVVIVGAGVVLALTTPRGILDLVVAVVVGGFLWVGSGDALRQATLRRHEDVPGEGPDEDGRSGR